MLTLTVVLSLMVDGGDKDLEYDVGVYGNNMIMMIINCFL